jgi:outer membrane immunogenic protein
MRTSMKTALAAAAAILLATTAASSAADLAVKAPYAAAPAPASSSWTGFYVGGNIGYDWGRSNSDTDWSNLGGAIGGGFISGVSAVTTNTPKLDSVSGGFQAGYNLQLSPTVVAGLEADWQEANAKASTSNSTTYDLFGIPGTASSNYQIKLQSFGTVRARLGYLVGDKLFYATGGFAYGREEAGGTLNDSIVLAGLPLLNASSGFDASKTAPGWTVGGGVEGPIANKLTWKAEYLYLDLKALNFSSPGPNAGEPFSGRTPFSENIIRVGLNYRLN